MDKTAIVILNWNGAAMLKRFLPNVLEFSREDATVIVADNASTDDSVKTLREQFPDVRLVLSDKNYGFAEGYNRALEKVEAEYYVLLNSDVEVSPNWLDPLTEFMDNNPDAAACQPKLLAMHNRKAFEYAGACGGFIDRFGYPFCRGRVFDTIEDDNGQYDTAVEVLWASGACMMIRSADFKAVGGFDGRFFAHCEEIDLCWRLKAAGRKIFCVPDSHVWHVGGGTLPKSNPMKTYLNFRNNLTMLYKNLPEEELGFVMRTRFILDLLAALQFLLKGKTGDAKAVIRGRRAFSKWKKEFEQDRKSIQTTSRNSSTVGRFRFSLLWQYYVRGRKKYSCLPLGQLALNGRKAALPTEKP